MRKRVRGYSPSWYAREYEKYSGNPEARVKAIAQAVGVKAMTVRMALKKAWPARRYKAAFKTTRNTISVSQAEFIALYEKHPDFRSLAKQLGVSPPTLYKKIKEWGLIKTLRQGRKPPGP